MEDEQVGLRELKKQMTRKTIASAALDLTQKTGLNDVTIEDIARQAFISPRTFSNYFASKEEAVLAAGELNGEDILSEFSDSPSEVPPLAALRDVFVSYAQKHPDDLRYVARMRGLELENPTLRPFRITQEVHLVEVLSSRIASRTGTNLSSDVYPSLVASAAVSCFVTALVLWSCEGLSDNRLPELIKEGFELVASGFPLDPVSTMRVEIQEPVNKSQGSHRV